MNSFNVRRFSQRSEHPWHGAVLFCLVRCILDSDSNKRRPKLVAFSSAMDDLPEIPLEGLQSLSVSPDELPDIPLYTVDVDICPDIPLEEVQIRPTARGGGGQLQPQAQAMIYHLHKTFEGHLAEVCKVLGWTTKMKMAGFLAKATGLSRGCLEKRLKDLESRGGIPRQIIIHSGRKRKSREVDDDVDEDSQSNGLPADVPAAASVSATSATSSSSKLSLTGVVEPGSFWGSHQRVRCPYKGLGILDEKGQEQLVGLRLSCLALELSSQGSLHGFTDTVSMLDAFLPGELGEKQHSAWFARGIVREAVGCTRLHVAWSLDGPRHPGRHFFQHRWHHDCCG